MLISMSCGRKQRRSNNVHMTVYAMDHFSTSCQQCLPALPAVWRDSWSLRRSGSHLAEPETQTETFSAHVWFLFRCCSSAGVFRPLTSVGRFALMSSSSSLTWTEERYYTFIYIMQYTLLFLTQNNYEKNPYFQSFSPPNITSCPKPPLHLLPDPSHSVLATHSESAGFSEKTLSTKSASLCGSKVEGTMMYSPAGSRNRELTSLRLMKSSERALEAWVRKNSRFRWTPDRPENWQGRQVLLIFSKLF